MKMFIIPVNEGCIMAWGDERPEGEMVFVRDFDRTQIMGATNVVNLPTIPLPHDEAARVIAVIYGTLADIAENNRRQVEFN